MVAADLETIMTRTLFDRRLFLAAAGAAGLSACETLDAETLGTILGSGILSQADAAKGIRAALDNGVGLAVATVGKDGGFLNDNKIRIPLPKALQDVKSVLSIVGAQGLMSDLEVQLNRGAEKAAPVAKSIFLDAISALTIQDAIGIVKGADNAATQYLQAATTPKLTSLFSPIMENALGQTGALRLFDQLSGQVKNIPLAPQLGADAKQNLISHGVDYALGGVFHYIGEEERMIRENPAKRTSEILRRVFGAA